MTRVSVFGSMTPFLAGAAVAALALALMTAGAQAQGMGGFGSGRHQHKVDATKPQKPKVDEKAYQAALKSVPNKKSDPWGGVR